jgi:hypothetical protein
MRAINAMLLSNNARIKKIRRGQAQPLLGRCCRQALPQDVSKQALASVLTLIVAWISQQS